MADTALISASNVCVDFVGGRGAFGLKNQTTRVLHGVDVTIGRGEIVGIVGESGSGKSTLGRVLLGMLKPTEGQVLFEGQPIEGIDGGRMALRRRLQMIFQDPMSSLNPRHTLWETLSRPILLHGVAADANAAQIRISAVLDRVGLPQSVLTRYPHELSGGQRQRIGIARAIMLGPSFVLADEIVSGQDVSTQARVLQLLRELTAESGLSMAFISHDLSVIRALCSRVYVLNSGQVVEQGRCDTVFSTPQHAYTKALIAAIPLPVVDGNWLKEPLA